MTLTLLEGSLETLFITKIERLPCQRDTKAYILGVFSSPTKTSDFSNESITIVYSRAKEEYKMELFQALADWIMFAQTIFPESLNGATPEYYQTIAQLSYYRCYKMINKQWALFEELADNLPRLIKEMQISFHLDQMAPSPLLFQSIRT